MQFHRGRLVDHVHLRVANLDAAKWFYRAVLESLGRAQGIREGRDFFNADELWIDKTDSAVSRVHLAFQADSPAQVQAFTQRRCAPAAATTARPASAPTIRATTPPSCWIPTATTSRPCTTVRRRDRPNRSS